MGELLDKVMDLRHPCCRDNFLHRSVGPAISDVFADGERKDKRRLKNHSDIAAQRLQLKFAQIDSINGHPSSLSIIETRQKTHQCGFSRSGGPYDRDLFSRCDAKA